MKKGTSAQSAPKSATKAPAKRATANSANGPKKSAEVVPASAKVSTTTVVARVDVGFGNRLYIRGEGPGLSWERGLPMECASSDTWTWSTAAANRPFAYKLLLNDERWSEGGDLVADAGRENTATPAF